MQRIRKGDEVIIVSGKKTDVGRQARVLRIEGESAIVEQVNMVKKHTKANPQKNIKGGILEKESPIRLSKLMLVDPETGKPTRVGYSLLSDGRKVRVARGSGTIIDK